MTPGFLRRHGLEIALYLPLLVLPLAFLDWGLPQLWQPDDVGWVVRNMLTSTGPNPNHFIYPSFNLYCFYLPCQALDWVGLVDPASMTGIGRVCRLVNVLFYLLTVFVTSRTVTLVFPDARPHFAAAFTGTVAAFVHHAHFGTVNSGLFFAIALALHAFVRTLRSGRDRDFLLSVAACALATGTKYNALFLFAALPPLWIATFGARSIASPRFLRILGLSLLLAPAVFLATTPYALLDRGAFLRDLHYLRTVAQSDPRGVTAISYADEWWLFASGAFSPATLVTLLFWLASAIPILLLPLLDPARRSALLARDGLLLRAGAVLLPAWAAFEALNYASAVHEARHFLPGSVVLLTLFLLAVHGLHRALAPRAARFALAATLGLALASNDLNVFAHLHFFPASAHSAATEVLQARLARSPGRVQVLAFDDRVPFLAGPFADRVDVFHVRRAVPEGVETWDDYLAFIARSLGPNPPRLLVLEESVYYWYAFHPPRLKGDVLAAFHIRNPGTRAWERMLAGLGYRRVLTFCQEAFPLRRLLGDSYLATSRPLQIEVLVYMRQD